ncbi:LCP family protein, partial [Frankia sp. AgKG'84/4]|uniref:LCP family protein n=1 Tax=Frankia sp. AgKG'84/4 TaxID=573490 RepID=UPI00202A0229
MSGDALPDAPHADAPHADAPHADAPHADAPDSAERTAATAMATVAAASAVTSGAASAVEAADPLRALIGDTPAPPGRRGLRYRIVLLLAGVLSVAILASTVAGWITLTVYDRKIDRADIGLPRVEASRPPTVPAGTENWLLVGSDVRTGTDAAKVGGARSDTMMIAHLDSDGRTSIVSIPRDLYLPIPAYTDADGTRHRERHDRVNSAFNSGGPALLVATLEQLTGIRIDHYAEVDFGGFQAMTTAIGGVDVCLTASPDVESLTLENGRRVRSTNLNDPSSGFVGQVGVNHLLGAQALAFVRQRHGFLDGDLSRIHRQQAFLAAVFRKVASSDVLLRPAKLSAFLSALTRSTVLDNGTNLADLRRLADRLRGIDAGSVSFATVPVTGQVAHPAFYFLYDPDAVRTFFATTMGDGSTPDPSTPAPLVVPGQTPQVTPTVGTSPTTSPSGATASAQTQATGTLAAGSLAIGTLVAESPSTGSPVTGSPAASQPAAAGPAGASP